MKSATTLGYYGAFIAFLSAVGYCVSQVLQVMGYVTYPLADELIYGFSLGIALPFLLAILALHYTAPEDKKLWTHGALLLSVIYCTYVTLMYTVQLSSVIPASLRGSKNELLTVYPQSFFWTIDALGYIFMGLATAMLIPVFKITGRERRLRWFCIANSLVTVPVGVVYFYPHFSVALLFIASPWVITMPGCALLLAVYFKRLNK
jgi:hypothetical protein